MRNITDYFLELVQIDSESKNEREMAERMMQDLQTLGAQVEIDDAHEGSGGNSGNVFAVIPGQCDAPPILLSAHLDTVRPGCGVKPSLRDGYIVSDGTTILGSDDKSGIAQIVCAIEEVLSCDHPLPPVEILLTVSEEIGLLGAKAFDYKKLKSRIGFCLDATTVGHFMNGAPAQNSLHFTIRGKSAHAGMEPEKGINAIRIAADAINRLRLGRIDSETTSNIGVIEGGIATNIVPDTVRVKGEIRSHDNVKLEELTDFMKKTFLDTAAMYRLGEDVATVQAEIVREFDAFHIPSEDPLVRLAVQSAADVALESNLYRGGGGSDGNIFNQHGIRTIVAGTGMDRVHTVNERILEKDLIAGKEWLKRVLINHAKENGYE